MIDIQTIWHKNKIPEFRSGHVMRHGQMSYHPDPAADICPGYMSDGPATLKKWKEYCFNLYFKDICLLAKYKYKISQQLSILLPTDIVRLVSTFIELPKSIYPYFVQEVVFSNDATFSWGNYSSTWLIHTFISN